MDNNDRKDLLIWVDLETTGLDCDDNMKGVQTHKILEVGIHITDSNFNIIDEGLELIIHHDLKDIKPLMVDFVYNMHSKNGLLDKVEKSTTSLEQSQEIIMQYVKQFNIAPKSSPICGNNVGFDRNFIDAQMPEFSQLLHYRKIDVSSFKEVATRLYPDVAKMIDKKAKHRALDDIKESIIELKVYQQYMLQPPTTPSNKMKMK